MSSYTTPRRRRPVLLTAAALTTVLTGTLAGCAESDASDATGAARPSGGSSAAQPVEPSGGSSAAADSSLHMVSHNGRKLAFHVTPGDLPAIVLDSGGGLDSSQWKDLVPVLARKTGSKIITYDRAGMGQSDEVVGPWNAESAASDLEAGLKKLGATRDVILVSHSQGGEVATYFAKKNPKWVSGAVLVDASLPNLYTDNVVAAMVAANESQVAQLDGKPSTKEIRQLLATADNYGPMHEAYHEVSWPAGVPATAIVSEKTPFETPAEAQLWREAQADFAKAGTDRKLVVAKGSSHDIPADGPEFVVGAVDALVKARG